MKTTFWLSLIVVMVFSFMIYPPFTWGEESLTTSSPGNPNSNEPSKKALHKCFSPHPKSHSFCSGRVYPEGMKGHISWQAYASKQSLNQLKTYFDKTCPKEFQGDPNLPNQWRYTQGQVQKSLSLSAPPALGPWQKCPIPEGTQSIIEISEFTI